MKITGKHVLFILTGCIIICLSLISGCERSMGNESKNPVAKAQFEPNPQNAGKPVKFWDDGSNDPDGGSILKYEWDWDNNGTFDTVGKTVTRTWTTPGTYKVQFRVTDDENAKDLLDQPLTVNIAAGFPPVAKASYEPNNASVNQPVAFRDNGSLDPDGGSIVKYYWDWDSDKTPEHNRLKPAYYDQEGKSVEHAFHTAGIHYVQLLVVDDEGVVDILDTPISIKIQPLPTKPVAKAKAIPTTAGKNVPIHFIDDGSFDPDGGAIVLYQWDWNNDGVWDAPWGKDQYRSWDTPGTYRVQFKVTDDEGETDTLDYALEIRITGDGWARGWGGTADDIGYDVAVDSSGNAFVAGSFMGSMDIDPGPNVITRTAQGSSTDCFLSRLNSKGEFVWGPAWGGSGRDRVRGVALDGSGNVYLAGVFEGTCDFDPGTTALNIQSKGGRDAFLMKFSPSAAMNYVKTWGAHYSLGDGAYSVVCDQANYVWVTGDFYGGVDMDPSSAVDYRQSTGGTNMLANFLNKFDSSGNYQLSRTWGAHYGLENLDCGIAMAPGGYPYVASYFNGNVDFDPSATKTDFHNSYGSWDGLLVKYDNVGNYQYGRSWGVASSTSKVAASACAVDSSGNVYIAGGFQGSVDLNPGSGTAIFYSAGSWDAFLIKLNAAGDFLWGKVWGSPGADYAYDVAVGDSNNVYVTGYFTGLVDFDIGAPTVERASKGYEDIFLCKYAADGSLLWVDTFGGPNGDFGYAVDWSSIGRVFVTGSFRYVVDFDPGPGIYELTSKGNSDVFLMSLLPNGMW